MAQGLIQDKMSRPEGEDLTLENIQSNIKIPPELQEAYERTVIAGMKVMFSKESHQFMLKEIQKPGDMGDKLGQSVAGLMLMLFKESNQSMPPQVIIPAGLELLMQAADFLKNTNMGKPTNEELGRAMQVMINMIMQGFGLKPEQFAQALNSFDNSNIPAAAEQMGAGSQPMGA
jgi:hypothetical protein